MTILKKKILIVLPNLNSGGAERLAVSLANEWNVKGYRVEFALLQKSGKFLDLIDDGVMVHDLNIFRLRSSILPLCRLFKSVRPDVIWSGLWPLTAISVLAWILAGKKGRIYTIDHNQLSISTVKELKIPKSILKIITRCTYPFATGNMAVAKGVKRDLVHLTGLPKDKIKVIYNPAAQGIGLKQRSSTKRKNELWGDHPGKCILSVGSFKEQKNFKLLIETFSLFLLDTHATLTILGDGELRLDLEKQINDLGIQDRVFLPGFTDEPWPWFLSADVFVLSSNWEGLPTVLVEALDCGLPVVSTDTPTGPSEILEGGLWGILVPPNDATSLLNGIKESVTKTHDRNNLMKRADDFSVKNISLKYLEYFELL
jgi:glycosyltransferase involved in cell wall biosynthesis